MEAPPNASSSPCKPSQSSGKSENQHSHKRGCFTSPPLYQKDSMDWQRTVPLNTPPHPYSQTRLWKDVMLPNTAYSRDTFFCKVQRLTPEGLLRALALTPTAFEHSLCPPVPLSWHNTIQTDCLVSKQWNTAHYILELIYYMPLKIHHLILSRLTGISSHS